MKYSTVKLQPELKICPIQNESCGKFKLYVVMMNLSELDKKKFVTLAREVDCMYFIVDDDPKQLFSSKNESVESITLHLKEIDSFLSNLQSLPHTILLSHRKPADAVIQIIGIHEDFIKSLVNS